MSNTSSTATLPLSLRTRSTTNRPIRREVNMLDSGGSYDNQLSGPDLPGYWTRRQVDDPMDNAVSALAPLFTRFQPPYSCPKSGPYTKEGCHFAMNLERFDPYHFVWNDHVISSSTLNSINETHKPTSVNNRTHFDQHLKQRIREQQRRDDIVCLFGASHSRYLRDFLRLLTSTPVLYVDTKLARELGTLRGSTTEIAHQVRLHAEQKSNLGNRNCTIALVGIGTWDAGFPESRPTPLDEYEPQMVRTLANVRLTYPAASVYAWSAHYHVLGTRLYQKCPLQDWRHPPLIDQYNASLQRIVKQQVSTTTSESGVSESTTTSVSSIPLPPLQYLDTSFITTPQWDSPPDWCHFNNSVGQTEALYIAAVVFGVLPLFDTITNYSYS
jgi:hypothetical protein